MRCVMSGMATNPWLHRLQKRHCKVRHRQSARDLPPSPHPPDVSGSSLRMQQHDADAAFQVCRPLLFMQSSWGMSSSSESRHARRPPGAAAEQCSRSTVRYVQQQNAERGRPIWWITISSARRRSLSGSARPAGRVSVIHGISGTSSIPGSEMLTSAGTAAKGVRNDGAKRAHQSFAHWGRSLFPCCHRRCMLHSGAGDVRWMRTQGRIPIRLAGMLDQMSG